MKNGSIFRNRNDFILPFYYVFEQSPPTLIIQGDTDPTVPYQPSVLLFEKLKNYGAKTEFMTVKGGEHRKFSKEENSNFSKKMWTFLRELNL